MEDKARVNRVRRLAERRGYRIRKSRSTDPLAVDYGWHVYPDRGSREIARFGDLGRLEEWLAGRSRRQETQDHQGR